MSGSPRKEIEPGDWYGADIEAPDENTAILRAGAMAAGDPASYRCVIRHGELVVLSVTEVKPDLEDLKRKMD